MAGLRKRVRDAQAILEGFNEKNAINLGAVVGCCLLLLSTGTVLPLLGAAAALASFVAIVWRRYEQVVAPRTANLLGYFVTVRALLVLAVAGGFVLRRPDEWAWVAAASVLLVMSVMAEPLLRTLTGRPRLTVVNLAGIRTAPKAPFHDSWLPTLQLAALPVGGLLAALAAPGWTWLLVAMGLAVPLVVLIGHGVLAEAINRNTYRRVPRAVAALQPKFAVYYGAVAGVRYQMGMWLPYLERLGVPFIVITRNPVTVPAIADLTSAPIIAPGAGSAAETLDALVVPSMNAAFYVQGSPANQTFQRYRELTHVWLNHGDSDKQANFHPRHATYDKLFVSGQQGVDRYADHGIEVPASRFEIVGRPQLEKIKVRDTPLPAGAPRTLLYAPTWRGGRPSSNYSSLPLAEAMVTAVLARGATVIFRPHPLSYNDTKDAKRIAAVHRLLEADRKATGRTHVWGRQAEKEWDVPDCFNASDTLITDVSSIASDYLASGKPFAMCAILNTGPAFLAETPTAKVAYVIEKDLSTLEGVLDHLLGTDDPLASARHAYRRYCVGDHLGADAPKEFLRVAGEIVAGRR